MSIMTPVRIGCVAAMVGLGFIRPTYSQNTDPIEPKWTAEQKTHWSFLPPVRPEIPQVANRGWVRNPIDAFILSTLETVELAPAPQADKATLIRRLAFDLTGLPPSPEAVQAFLADDRADAYERLVDRLLGSTAYGERWARAWLDLARYAESDGFKSDKTRPTAWRYRDWVISSLNADMPYDRFVSLQLAGDEIAPDDSSAFMATAFNRHWPFEDNNKVPGLNRQLMLDDMTDTTASVFLGLTVGCARCHNHKFDPISQKDYYRFQAFFSATEPDDDYQLASPAEKALFASIEAEHKARLGKVKKEIEAIERPYLGKVLGQAMAKLPPEVRTAVETDPEKRTAQQDDLLAKYAKQLTVEPKAMQAAMSVDDRKTWTIRTSLMKRLNQSGPRALDTATGMTDVSPNPPPVYLLRKGNPKNPGGEVAPGYLSVLASAGETPKFAPTPAGTSGRRKALAEWMTRPDHPLTARVLVNRLWLGHFGRGIVTTPSDFGKQGTEPSHPELLDWLATEFVREGWSLKAMHRLMVTSSTYRQSSTPSAKVREHDPDNTLFARMVRRRLEGEAVRDALLAVSGRLDTRLGGESVFPDLPPGLETRGGWTRSASEADRNRRSIYVFVRRNLKYPLFDAFDAPDSNTTCAERNITVNAPQALMLLNSELVLDQARSLAGRIYEQAVPRDDKASLVQTAYRQTFGRSADPDEIARGIAFLETQPTRLSGRPQGKPLALPSPAPDGIVPVQAAALVDFCHVLLNLNEFVFVD